MCRILYLRKCVPQTPPGALKIARRSRNRSGLSHHFHGFRVPRGGMRALWQFGCRLEGGSPRRLTSSKGQRAKPNRARRKGLRKRRLHRTSAIVKTTNEPISSRSTERWTRRVCEIDETKPTGPGRNENGGRKIGGFANLTKQSQRAGKDGAMRTEDGGMRTGGFAKSTKQSQRARKGRVSLPLPGSGWFPVGSQSGGRDGQLPSSVISMSLYRTSIGGPTWV